MLPLLLLLAALVVVVLIIHWATHLRHKGYAAPAPVDTVKDSDEGRSACSGCAIESASCYADRMLRTGSFEIVYFDDEHLDAYRGRNSGAYTAAEAEEFREVALTMRPSELPDWLHSLQLRGLELPADVRDEVILLLADDAPSQ